MTSPDQSATFTELLRSAVEEPGTISRAYSAFHNYSLGNQLLALAQCLQRGITPGPIATFMGWKDKGRYVRKGEKAITLCQPVTVKGRRDEEDEGDEQVYTRFVYKPHWFVVAQTEGQELPAATLPTWDRARALVALDITEVPFDLLDGNCQGFARQRSISVSPVAALPFKTAFHEVAHVLLSEVILQQFRAADVRVLTADGQELTANDDPTRRLIRQVLAAVAEFDKGVTVLKLRAARDRIRRRAGRCEGRKPCLRNARSVCEKGASAEAGAGCPRSARLRRRGGQERLRSQRIVAIRSIGPPVSAGCPPIQSIVSASLLLTSGRTLRRGYALKGAAGGAGGSPSSPDSLICPRSFRQVYASRLHPDVY